MPQPWMELALYIGSDVSEGRLFHVRLIFPGKSILVEPGPLYFHGPYPIVFGSSNRFTE